jgi:hypothetical protein
MQGVGFGDGVLVDLAGLGDGFGDGGVDNHQKSEVDGREVGKEDGWTVESVPYFLEAVVWVAIERWVEEGTGVMEVADQPVSRE